MLFCYVHLVASLPGFALSSGLQCSAGADIVPVGVLPMCPPYAHSFHIVRTGIPNIFGAQTYGESLAAVSVLEQIASTVDNVGLSWLCKHQTKVCLRSMPAQLSIHSFGRIGMLMFRATSANPGVKIVAFRAPFRLLDHIVQRSSTTKSTSDSTHHHECWFLDVERLSASSFVAVSRHLSVFVEGIIFSIQTLQWSLTKSLFFLEFAACDCQSGCTTTGLVGHQASHHSKQLAEQTAKGSTWEPGQHISCGEVVICPEFVVENDESVSYCSCCVRRSDGLHDHRSCIGSAAFSNARLTSGIFELSCFLADLFHVKLTLTCTARSRDIRATWRSFCVFRTAVPKVSATELEFATSLCEVR